jgi:hypothetical protein
LIGLAQQRYNLGLSSIDEFSQAELAKTEADIADTDAKIRISLDPNRSRLRDFSTEVGLNLRPLHRGLQSESFRTRGELLPEELSSALKTYLKRGAVLYCVAQQLSAFDR